MNFWDVLTMENTMCLPDYDRFSISGGVKGEIHGGASLEEVLVLVIELSKSPLMKLIFLYC